MKRLRSASAHHQSVKGQVTAKPSPTRNSKLVEVNNKINSMLLKVRTPELPESTESTLQIQYNYTRVLATIQKEKNSLLTLMSQKDGIIQEQMKKITAQGIEIKNLQSQIQKYQQIPTQMEQLEMQCSTIIQENHRLKQQVLQLQTSYSFLQSQQLQVMVSELEQLVSQVGQSVSKNVSLLEYAVKKEYDNFQLLINIKSRPQTGQRTEKVNLNAVLLEVIEQLRKMGQKLDSSFEDNYKQISDQLFYAFNN